MIGNGVFDEHSDKDLSDDPGKYVGFDNSGWDSDGTLEPPKVDKPMPTHHQPVSRTAPALGA